MVQFEWLSPAADCPRVSAIWRELADASEASFFLSWGTIRTWLKHLPEGHGVRLLVGSDGGRQVMACFLGEAPFSRHGLFRGRRIHLNTAGTPEGDLLHMEYNDVLLHPAADVGYLLAALFEFLGGPHGLRWDEFALSGLAEGSRLLSYLRSTPPPGYLLEVDIETISPYVDLDAVRRMGGDFLATLSPNARQQLRQSLRAYKAGGPLMFETARTPEAALGILDELTRLHQAAWKMRGKPGVFYREAVREFHRDLVREGVREGTVQLARVICGETTIGCLYSFLHRGRVYFYQSGFAYGDDAKKRPGMIAHYLAICYHLDAGSRTYDFLAGKDRYKMSFANAAVPMVWYRLQFPRLRFRVERALRRAYAHRPWQAGMRLNLR